MSTTTVLGGHKLKVSYIDVGQADSILIQTPGGKNVLIDAGNNGDATTIVNYLKTQNISRLDYVIGTHSHEDHIGSLDTVIKTFDIGQVVMPKESSNTQTFRDVMTAIANKGLKPIQAKAGVKLNLGSEIYAELLAPNSSGYEGINDYSAVVRLVYGKNSFLFTGDAEAQSESEMLHATIYRTDESGTIVCESDGETITFKTLGSSVQPRAPSAAPAAAVIAKPVPVPSQSNNQGATVYGTATGAKYHADGCRYLAKSKVPMTLSAAKSKGLTACSVCGPPQ